MTTSIVQPKRESTTQKITTLLGSGLGAVFGGPSGAAGGMAAGNQAGQALSDQRQPQSLEANSAMTRRMAGSQPSSTQMPEASDNRAALEQARIALQSQSPEVRQQYEAPIIAALMKQRREEQNQMSMMK